MNREGPPDRLRHISETLGTGGPAAALRRETRVESLVCSECEQPYEAEVTIYWLFGKERAVRPRACSECRSQQQAEQARKMEETLRLERVAVREEWRRRCGIPEDFQLKTFDMFHRELQSDAFDTTFEWADRFWVDGPRGYPSLLFYSDGPGVGKSHLMSAIANHIIHCWEGDPRHAICPVRFDSGPGLVRRVRATYNIPRDDQWHEREEDVYADLRAVFLLMLDDMGKEKPSDHTREIYWHIIDERVKRGLPMVMSSNLPPQSLEQLMGGYAVDRLIGMTGGRVIDMTGPSYRKTRLVP